ncbi:hypothetical protein ASG35_08335 [Burkholderia sp. Leaf177]|nr:hypothetical protein ASG35_08335 [Burkholderia sp. Leaf177]
MCLAVAYHSRTARYTLYTHAYYLTIAASFCPIVSGEPVIAALVSDLQTGLCAELRALSYLVTARKRCRGRRFDRKEPY